MQWRGDRQLQGHGDRLQQGRQQVWQTTILRLAGHVNFGACKGPEAG
jgi:hypothetical protein